MTDMMRAYNEWVSTGPGRHERFRDYINAVAEARHIIRKMLRIVEEQAKQQGLDPLEHQALLQIYAADNHAVPVSRVAERLDIAPAFASRLIRGLEEKGLVTREQSTQDRRVTFVTATDAGVEILRRVDASVHHHAQYFRSQLSDDARESALATFVFYLGYADDSPVATAIRKVLSTARHG